MCDRNEKLDLISGKTNKPTNNQHFSKNNFVEDWRTLRENVKSENEKRARLRCSRRTEKSAMFLASSLNTGAANWLASRLSGACVWVHLVR